MRRMLAKKDGYILSWILCFFLVVSMLAVTTASYAILSTQSTQVRHNMRQAQFTAKSAASATANYIVKNASKPEVLATLMNSTGTGSIEGMGNYSVEVTKTQDNRIKVTATAFYQGQSYKTSAYLKKKVGTSAKGLIPTEHVIYVAEHYVNALDLSTWGGRSIEGSIYTNGSLYFAAAGGTNVSRRIISEGDMIIKNNTSGIESVFCTGNITLEGSSNITGDVRAHQGSLSLIGSSTIGGNVYVDNHLYVNSSIIKGNAYVGLNVEFGDSGTIEKPLEVGGALKLRDWAWQGNNINGFLPKGYTKKYSEFLPIDPSPYQAPQLEGVKPPSDYKTYKEITAMDSIISENVRLKSSWTMDKNVIVDATKKDIHIVFDNVTLDTNHKSLAVKVDSNNPHNVYIYMLGNSSINIRQQNSAYVGMYDRNAPLRLYILGDNTETQTITLNNGKMYACVYMPKGKFVAAGGDGDKDFRGICIVGKMEVNGGLSFEHVVPPDVDKVLLDKLEIGSWNSSTSSSWELGSWGE